MKVLYKNNSNAQGNKGSSVTVEQLLQGAAEALRKCTPEQLAQARQQLRERWGLGTPQWELELAGQQRLFGPSVVGSAGQGGEALRHSGRAGRGPSVAGGTLGA